MGKELATNLGKIIYRERVRKGISQEKLYRGICPQGDLSKIENGKRVPEKLLADALMQRLGRCTDTLEAIMSKEEYTLFDMRESLRRYFGGCPEEQETSQDTLLQSDEQCCISANSEKQSCDKRKKKSRDQRDTYEKVRKLIQEYRERKEARQPLHQQFLCKYEAVNEFRKHGDVPQCCRRLGKALDITLPKWKRLNLLEYCLCSQELHLLILIGYFMMREDAEYAMRLLDRVGDYLEQRYYEEEKVKLFPQCMWLLALYWKEQGNWDRVEKCSSKGVECLTKNSVLPLLVELLRLQLESRERLGRYADAGASEERRVLQNQLQSPEAVLQRYAGWVLEMDDLSQLHFFYHQDEISLDYETLRDIRRNRGLTQGKLKSCAQPSLSRIESGKQSPSHEHFREIVREMGVRKSYYISRVQAEDYDLYELAHWRNLASFHGDWEKEAVLLDKLEMSLDMGNPINQQYIKSCRIQEKKYRKEIEPEEGIRQLEQALQCTMPDYQEGRLRVPSREEFIILNQLAGFFRRAGNTEAGIRLRKHLLQAFQESQVKEEYHTNSILVLYFSYGEILEVAGELELAEKMDIRGIRSHIRCGKVDMIGEILANLAHVYEKNDSPEKHSLRKECLKNAYWLCLLVKHGKSAQIIKKCYHSMFDKDI